MRTTMGIITMDNSSDNVVGFNGECGDNMGAQFMVFIMGNG